MCFVETNFIAPAGHFYSEIKDGLMKIKSDH